MIVSIKRSQMTKKQRELFKLMCDYPSQHDICWAHYFFKLPTDCICDAIDIKSIGIIANIRKRVREEEEC